MGESDTPYAGEERRQYQKTIDAVEAAFTRALKDHEERERANVHTLLDELKKDAFPGGEPTPHKAYHQSKIDAARAEKEFWQAAKLKLVEKGVGALFHVIWIALGLVVLGLCMKLGIKPPEGLL